MKANFVRATLAVLILGGLAGGCLSRPVSTQQPTLKTNFTSEIHQTAVDKLDILFMIDNSASMGDKQAYLQQAIPDLINRLVTPNCVDDNGNTVGVSSGGNCATGQLEFPAVHDMHLGVISSSLGKRGGNLCDPAGTPAAPYANVSDHNDDQAHLLNRVLTVTPTSATEGTVPDAVDGTSGQPGYLYWFPTVAANNGKTPGPGKPLTGGANGTDPSTLINDFKELVTGVGFFGCGIESQLESWYRFLIQPDPYNTIDVDSNNHTVWTGVDTTILQQRHDFLRPDSLVTIITLSDENDSEIDVRALGGTAHFFMSSMFNPPHGTTPCTSRGPNAAPMNGDQGCTSCDFLSSAQQAADPACSGPYTGINDWGYDPNLRHVHMKAKYGVDPQFPISRYVNGLTSFSVPDRTGEYPDPGGGYAGNNNCLNPLFAANLPDGSSTDAATLCNAGGPTGSRTKELVFFAHIGGVPNQLLHFTPGNAQASTITNDDWIKILGTDPLNFDYTGIDPHMIESYQPRAGLSAPTSANNADPINGREWITDTGTGHVLPVDRQYACIFPLAQPRDCTQAANAEACDCPSSSTLTASQTPPLCNSANQTQQVAAKAYPTIRELTLTKLMGQQGIVSSLCPIHVTDQMGGTDPLYGYRPAIAAIVDRLKNALASQCLPFQLSPASDGSVPCLILATLPNTGATCDAALGLSKPDAQVLATFQANQEAAWQAAGGAKSGAPDPKTLTVCEVQQLTVAAGSSCKDSTTPGWCYVTGGPAGHCTQAILFGGGAPPTGSTVSLQCIQATDLSDAGTGGGG